jgi:tetratricopeptide (TPR) repeat protein
VPLSPQKEAGSRAYEQGWRAINELIRADGSWSGRERNVCYRNSGNGRFEDVSYGSGLDFPDDSRAWVWLDLDGDGDLDLILKSRTGPQVRVLQNEAAGEGLLVELEGVQSNRDAVGAVVTLVTGTERRRRELRSGSGFLSQSSRRVHFGIRQAERVQALEITWPGGAKERIQNPPRRGWIRVRQGEFRWTRLQPKPNPLPPAPVAAFVEQPWLSEPVELPDARLNRYRGRKVLLNLWASWCPPCISELKELSANASSLQAAGVQVVTLKLDENPKAELRNPFPSLNTDERLAGVYSLLYRYLFDRRREMGLPLSFLLDEQGLIRKLYQGSVSAESVIRDSRAQNRPSLPFPGRRYGEPPRRNYNELATAMTERGFAAEAEMLFAAAVRKGIGGYELLNNYAGVLIGRGDRAGAEKLLRQSVAESPNQASSQSNLGSLLLETGRAEEALPPLRKALELTPDDDRIRRTLSSACNEAGIAHMEAGRSVQGRRMFEEAIQADPTDTAGPINLALYHAQYGNRAEARSILQSLLKKDPQLAPARELLDQLR